MSTWVLLRGWARESRHWGGFEETLRAFLPGARVAALDLPGNGEFHERASPTSAAGMVSHCRREMDARHLAPPFHLLGLSFGAMICIEWASRHPAEIAGAVLLNTSVRPFSPFHARLRPRHYGALLRLALLERDVAAREAAILRLTSAADCIDEATLESWTRIAWQRPVSRTNVLRQLLAAARYRAPAARPPVPILVLCGGGDALVDPRCSRDLARRWNAPLAVHPTAGHDLALDDGAWVAAQVKRWLTQT